MIEIHPKSIESRRRALILFWLLAGGYVAGISSLWRAPDQTAPLTQVSVLAKLSLTDSGIVRVERRFSKLDGKTYRRHAPVDLHPASNAAILTLKRPPQKFSLHGELSRTLITLSPPGGRAPPRLTL